MTLDQLNDKRLLDYRAELEGMISENRLREIKGYSPAYGEKEFDDLSNKYHNIFYYVVKESE